MRGPFRAGGAEAAVALAVDATQLGYSRNLAEGHAIEQKILAKKSSREFPAEMWLRLPLLLIDESVVDRVQREFEAV